MCQHLDIHLILCTWTELLSKRLFLYEHLNILSSLCVMLYCLSNVALNGPETLPACMLNTCAL